MAKFWVEEDSNWIYSQITDETEYELTKVGDTKVVKMFCKVCVHCGQPINYNVAPSSTDDSYEPDHRIDVALHPEYAFLPENVQPSHRRCNRARGRRAGINELGSRTRDWGSGL